jgi:hypothetical protein
MVDNEFFMIFIWLPIGAGLFFGFFVLLEKVGNRTTIATHSEDSFFSKIIMSVGVLSLIFFFFWLTTKLP